MKNELCVYFGSDLWTREGRSRRGIELPVNKEFEFAGRRFLVPSVWSCAGGLVIDVIMKVDASAYFAFMKKWGLESGDAPEDADPDTLMLIERENPLGFDYSMRVKVNGRELEPAACCGIGYVPCLEYSDEDGRIIDSLIGHYKLLPGSAFMLMRHQFAWKKREKDIGSLEIGLTEQPSPADGPEFTVDSPKKTVRFPDLFSNTERELRVIGYQVMNNELRDPEDRTRIVGVSSLANIVYTVEPDGGDVRLFCAVDGKLSAGMTGAPCGSGLDEAGRKLRTASSKPFSGGKVSWRIKLYPEPCRKTLELIA